MRHKCKKVDYMAPRIKRHQYPLWKDNTTTWIYAHITDRGHAGRLYDGLEQIPASHESGNNYQICCVPLGIYGYALGDVVETIKSGNMRYISGIVSRSGHYTLRLMYSPGSNLDIHKRVAEELSSLGCSVEREDDRRCAIDAPDRKSADLALTFLKGYADSSLLICESGWGPGELGSETRRMGADWPSEIVVHKSSLDMTEPFYLREVLAQIALDGSDRSTGVCYEQLCLRQVGEFLSEVCCIPFRFRNMNLSDVVHICVNGNGHQELREIHSPSGNRTLHVQLVQGLDGGAREHLQAHVQKWNGQIEFEEDLTRCAISIRGESEAGELTRYLNGRSSSLGIVDVERRWL